MLRCSARRLAASRTGTRRLLGIALRPPLRHALTPARRRPHRCFPALGQLLQHRCLATRSAQMMKRNTSSTRATSRSNSRRCRPSAASTRRAGSDTWPRTRSSSTRRAPSPRTAASWASSASRAWPAGRSSCARSRRRPWGASSSTPRRRRPTLRVTTYGPAGGERVDEAPLVDIIPRSAPSDTSRLKTFCLPDDETRAYLVLVDPGSVKDPGRLAESAPRRARRRGRRPADRSAAAAAAEAAPRELSRGARCSVFGGRRRRRRLVGASPFAVLRSLQTKRVFDPSVVLLSGDRQGGDGGRRVVRR